jgi:hypothetical protein
VPVFDFARRALSQLAQRHIKDFDTGVKVKRARSATRGALI